MPAEAARKVFMRAWAATPLAASAEPALKPNQPNHRMPVPSMVSGRECGGMPSRGQPRRLPSTSTMARAAAPALMCTTAPPAKSRAPELGQTSRWREHPVGDRGVDDDRPDADEHGVGH